MEPKMPLIGYGALTQRHIWNGDKNFLFPNGEKLCHSFYIIEQEELNFASTSLMCMESDGAANSTKWVRRRRRRPNKQINFIRGSPSSKKCMLLAASSCILVAPTGHRPRRVKLNFPIFYSAGINKPRKFTRPVVQTHLFSLNVSLLAKICRLELFGFWR